MDRQENNSVKEQHLKDSCRVLLNRLLNEISLFMNISLGDLGRTLEHSMFNDSQLINDEANDSDEGTLRFDDHMKMKLESAQKSKQNQVLNLKMLEDLSLNDKMSLLFEQHYKDKEKAEEIEKLRETGVYNVFREKSIADLVKHIRKHREVAEKCQDNKELINQVYGGTFEMHRYIQNLLVRYLRGLRCYHLKVQNSSQKVIESKFGQAQSEKVLNDDMREAGASIENFCSCLDYFLKILTQHSSIRIRSLEDILEAFKEMMMHMEHKLKADP